MNTPPMNTASLRQSHIEQIRTTFHEPPSLQAVAEQSAQVYLDERASERRFSAGLIHIGTPSQPGAYDYQSLPALLLERLARARPVYLVEDYHVVARRVRETYEPGGPTLAEVEQLVNACGPKLLAAYAQRLQAWWREPLAMNMTRWGYLSDDLLAMLYDAMPPPGLSREAFARRFPTHLLRPVRPDSQWSLAGDALRIYSVSLRGDDGTTQQLPVLLLEPVAPIGESSVLLFNPASGVRLLADLDEVGALLPAAIHPTMDAAAGQWFVQRVQGDPFDALAASYLQRQLRALESLNPCVPRSVEQYQALLVAITQPRHWFVAPLSDVQQRLRSELPRWLLHAGVTDSLAYARLLQKAALLQQAEPGHYLDGIDPIGAFAETHLQQCLARHPQAASLKPGDIHLTFERVIAAAVPVPGGFIAGQVEPIDVSLTELALANLAGFPHRVKAIRVSGKPAPAWLTYDLLKACVTQADVGQAYPALLKNKLIDDGAQASRRRRLFSLQWQVQLPMLALEYKVRNLHGLTQAGFERVSAVVKAQDPAVALWPLAFVARPEAAADTVAAMFVIGPRQGEDGPHLLYRPLFDPVLQEYPSAAALLAAIAASGDLQDNVLAWLPAQRQAVYANRGFAEPHIHQFRITDEFTVYAKPAPARLGKQVDNDDPAHQVFAATARALVALADRQSVSNAEQRWATLKTGGWLLLNSVLPFFRGPLMLGGWLLTLMDSVHQDLQADAAHQSAAIMDMLANLVVILAHQAVPEDVQSHVDLEHPAFAELNRAEWPLRRIESPASFTAPAGWANARDELTPALQARVQALSLKRLPAPWPTTLDGAEANGLLRDASHTPEQWQALVLGHVYRVRLEAGRVRIISADGATLGPWLKSPRPGRWEFDLGLSLRGGADAPDVRADADTLQQHYRQAGMGRARASMAMEVARTLATKPVGAIEEHQRNEALARYVAETERKVHFSLLELQLLKRLRELGPRPRYEEELCTVLESIILTTRLLDGQVRARMFAINTRLRPVFDVLENETPEEAGADINIQAHAALSTGMRELVAEHERAIHWRTLEQRHLDELKSVPKYGRDKAGALMQDLPPRPSVLDLQSLQLTTLWGSSIDVAGPPLAEELFANVSDTIDRARWATRSLADLPLLQTGAQERIELLESIDSVFAQTDDQIEFWRTMAPEKFDLLYLQKLQELLTQLHQHAERLLVEWLQPDPNPPQGPSTAVARRKKIIRTRNRDLYVAQVKAPTGRQAVETAELHDAQGQVIGTFTEAQDGIWESSTPQRAVSPPPLADAQLGELINKGRKSLREVEGAIHNVETMVTTVNDPASLQELLQAQARSRLWAADGIRNKLRSLETTRLAAVQRANAQTVEGDLRAAVSRLEAAGLAARLEATRRKVTTALDVAFLDSQNAVHIYPQGQRVPMPGRQNDFLQVYRVDDAQTSTALCFAHFHYERSQGPDDHYTAGHIKSPEQERQGRQAQAEAEAQAFARMRTGQAGRAQQTLEIHRAQIPLALARRLFFSTL